MSITPGDFNDPDSAEAKLAAAHFTVTRKSEKGIKPQAYCIRPERTTAEQMEPEEVTAGGR